MNEDKSEQADDETEEIVFKVPSISEVYFSIDHVRTFVSINSDINTPEARLLILLKNLIVPIINKAL